MEARQRPVSRSKIPSRVRTLSVPRPVKCVDFSPVSNELDEQMKRVRRKWKSFNLGRESLHSPRSAINNNNVDILTEWREELADEQDINSLLQLSKDLLGNLEAGNLGPEELRYRQEQALYWLCKAAERGSKEARDKLTCMLKKGQGINEANFEAVYSCSWIGGLSVPQLIGRRLGRKVFRKLELGRGFCTTDQIYRLIQGKDVNEMDGDDVKQRLKGSSAKVTEEQFALAGEQQMEGQLPDLDRKLDLFRGRTFITLDMLLFGIIIVLSTIMIHFGHVHALPPTAIALATLVVLSDYTTHRDLRKFEEWKKIWPKKLLIPGLFESAKAKFASRANVSASQKVLILASILAFVDSGSYINTILAILSILAVIGKKSSLLALISYLGLFMTQMLDDDYLPTYMAVPIPHMTSECIQLIAFGFIAYESFKTHQPQLLWTPVLLTSYCVNASSISWISVLALNIFVQAFANKASRVKTCVVIFIVIVLALPYWQTQHYASLKKKCATQEMQQLSWNEYSELCMADPWLQRPEQQIQCAKWIGLPVSWKARVSGLVLRPRTASHPLFTLYQRICSLFQDNDFCLMHAHLKWFLKCTLKLDMLNGRSLLGNYNVQTIYGELSDAQNCLGVEIGDSVLVDGYISDMAEASSPHIFILNLTSVPKY